MSTRVEKDAYPTPLPVARAICQRLAQMLLPPTYIIEPSAGTGSFLYAAREAWPGAPIYATDIQPGAEPACAATGTQWLGTCDWRNYVSQIALPEGTLVLGNPPFSQAEEHIRETVMRLPAGGVLAFLLKANFLSGERRARKLWTLPGFRYLLPIAGRPSFIKGEKATNDFNEYCIYVWCAGWAGRPEIVLPHIQWKGPCHRTGKSRKTKTETLAPPS
jgi:hypothetical protein